MPPAIENRRLRLMMPTIPSADGGAVVHRPEHGPSLIPDLRAPHGKSHARKAEAG